MAWFRVKLSEKQQRIVNEERFSHPNQRVQEKMFVLWLLHKGFTRQQVAGIVSVGRATAQRYIAAFREERFDGLRQCNVNRSVSEMAAYRELMRESFEKQPVCTVAEAGERIF
jgi:transposase